MIERNDVSRGGQESLGIPPWDPVSITRQRVEKRRAERDAAIGDLRGSVSDEQLLAVFGIDLGHLEG